MPGSSEDQLLPKGWESRSQGLPCSSCALADREQSCKDWTQGQSWGQVIGSIDITSNETGPESLQDLTWEQREKESGTDQGWGVYPGDRDRAADQHFYSVAGVGIGGPGAEMKS